MQCAQCRSEPPSDADFCPECGAKLGIICSQCSTENARNHKFCKKCGQALTQTVASDPSKSLFSPAPETYTPKHLAEKILTSKSALEGERKQVTVLFADLKGSMELLADRDPEESRTLLNAVVERMMEAVHRYEGTVNNVMGDGIMATFGAPLAHEDHALRACYAALRMQEAVSRYSTEVRRSQGIPVAIRVGLNSGEVIVGAVGDDLRMDYTSVGQTTHLAARMEQMAIPGSIMVSADTQKLTEGFFRYKELGLVQVKGLSDPTDAYELTGVGPLRTRLEVSARRGLVKFVGRQRELEQMRRALDMAKEGRGQITAIVGEPGVGKSRLCYEFKIIEEPGCLILEAFSVSHGKASPYLPITELLKNYFQITSEDDERTRREKVAGKVVVLDRSLEDTLPYLFFLLGIAEPGSSLHQMDAQIRRQRTLDAIKRLVLRESLNQPLLVIFEDLQWVDGETQAFLNLLGDSVASARIFLLVNYRPEYQHGWGSKTYYTQVRLDPLRQEDAQELLTVLLGDAKELTPLKNLLVEKTEGNPFFIEEVVQTLVEEQVLVGRTGGYRLEKPMSELQIPPTVQVALAARIDRLGPDEKGLLQAMAVMGRKFSSNLLTTVVDEPEEKLHGLLSHLRDGEFIYEQPAFPEVEYVFKHGLTQEVAYNSVLTNRRTVLHERTAQALEELYEDRLDEHYSDLAHHYRHSGNVPKAAEYLKLAGQQATSKSANEEAINYYTSALELLEKLPDTPERAQQELALQLALGVPLIVSKGHGVPEVERAFTRASELCQQIGETPELFRAQFGLWRFYNQRSELRLALQTGERLMSLAEKGKDPVRLLQAHRALGAVLFYLAEHGASREHLEKSIALYEPHRSLVFVFGIDPKAYCLIFLSLTQWLLGYPDQAVQTFHEARALAEKLSHPFTEAFVLMHGTRLHQHRRDVQAARELNHAAIALATEQGFPTQVGRGIVMRGWALAEQAHSSSKPREIEEGISDLREGMETLEAVGDVLYWPYYLTLLAEAYGKGGHSQKGLDTLSRAFGIVNGTSERWYEAELYRVKGALSLQLAHQGLESKILSEAEQCFRRAIEIARQQSAKSLELRAVTSLSQVLIRREKKDEARQALAEIYGWFTEGFDTGDLKEAKALLEELS